MDLSTIEARVQEFIQENKDLVEDPDTHPAVLGRVLVEAGEIATQFVDDLINPFVAQYQAHCDQVEQSFKDPTLRPRELQPPIMALGDLEREKREMLEAFWRFSSFTDEVTTAYNNKLDDDMFLVLEDLSP